MKKYNRLRNIRAKRVSRPGVIRILSVIVTVAACGSHTPRAMADDRPVPVRGWEGSLTLPTYPWHDDVNPVFAAYEDKIYYPYTRQDHIEKTKSDRTYRALYLENAYLRVTCLPELGGRIHSVFDKSTQQEMFHTNDVIKPAPIAMRGAWVSGGVEWNVGPQGHAVSVVSPVDALVKKNMDGSATIAIGMTEKMFRTRWGVRVTLHPGKAYLDEEIFLFNPTDGTHPYYFWNNTAFPHLPGTRFIFPMSLGTNHNGDKFYSWPIHEGVDQTWLKNHENMTALFAYECPFDFFGAYDVDLDRGIVCFADHRVLPGKKAWTWGTHDFGVVSQLGLSDAERERAQYIEIQSGPLPTQSDYGMLGPGGEVSWNEFWYPVHGLGTGFEYATRDVAFQSLRGEDGRLELRLLATGKFPGARLTLSHEGEPLLEQEMDLTPAQARAVSLEHVPGDRIDVHVSTREGETLARYATPLEIPKVEPPDEVKKRGKNAPKPTTAEEHVEKASRLDRRSGPMQARQAYLDALELDPHHVDALLALAILDLELGRYESAAEYAERVIALDDDRGRAWHVLGVCQFRRNDLDDALASARKCARTRETASLGDHLEGRVLMSLGRYDDAVDAFTRCLARDPADRRARDEVLVARYAAGADRATLRAAVGLIVEEDPTAFIPRAVAALTAEKEMVDFVRDVDRIAGDPEFTVLETAVFLENRGLLQEAARILVAAFVKESDAIRCSALPFYYLAFYCDGLERTQDAKRYLARAAAMSSDVVFPSRVEAIRVFTWALDRQPNDAQAHLLMGHLLAGLRRIDEALAMWSRAVELDLSLSVGWRLKGLQAWKKSEDPEAAATFFRKGHDARPEDQLICRDLAHVLEKLDRRGEAIRIVEKLRTGNPELRYDVAQWLADAYWAENQLDACIALLESTRFSNLEGSSKPRDTFARALLARGRIHFENERYTAALDNFEKSLTFPENLGVGARYNHVDAESRYWLGKTLLKMGRQERARAELTNGAGQNPENEHVQKCEELLREMSAKDG